ncbi:MAG TPA: methyltransferase domain-containing protein [Thermoplasmata archaeon]|nr:methyltransferase domain-containing protein [Thermoplasmata archaeon]
MTALSEIVGAASTAGPESSVTGALDGAYADDHLELTTSRGTVPLGFVAHRGVLYLVARDRRARWPVVALREGSARVRVRGRTIVGGIALITDPDEKRRVLDRFLAKYGGAQFARWYDRPARILRLQPTTGGPAEAAPAPPEYVEWLTAEFDNIAEEYDHHILDNRINRLLRNRSLAELRPTFRSAPVLLEIGCGSGTETLPMLRDGHEMLCIDISRRMLDVVRQKARAAGVAERLRTRVLRASEVGALVREMGPAQFDGGYSTYGALNCEADLTPIPPALHALLRPGSRFVAGVFNRWCLTEAVGYTLAGRPRRALGRTRNPVLVGSSRFCIDIWAHSAAEFEALFTPGFAAERLEAIPALLPSSEVAVFVEKFGRRFDRLAEWDRAWGTRWPLRRLGDHFLLTFVRVEDPGR